MLMAISWKTSVLPLISLSLQTLRMIYKTWANEYMTSARNTGWRSAYQKPKLWYSPMNTYFKTNIKLDDISLDQANRFKYLGVTITPSNDSTSEIKSRLLLASTALGKLQKVWSDKDITLSTKLRLLNALVYPVLLYGSEIYTIKKNETRSFWDALLQKGS